MPVLDVRVLSHGASLVLLPESATIRITAVDADGPRKRLEGSDLIFARTSAIEVRDGKPIRDIDLIPTDGTFCYQVTVTTTVGAFKLTRHVTIPDVPGPIRLGDRPDVDPATFQPTADVIAAWREVTAEVIAARDGSYAARTAAEAAASNASTAATAADTAQTSAAASAAAAGVAAGHAGDAATAADQAATGAGIVAGAAEGFARDADASATGALQSKNAAGTSAGSAATSATEAAGSATIATQRATDAAGSATTASQGATTATSAAADAAASKTGAQASATTADARAKDAATSATATAGSATTADQRATAAGQSATAAASSATAADGSKADALAARTGAQTAQAGAETAQTGAQGAKADAEKARDLALAGQFLGSSIPQNTDINTVTTPGSYRLATTVGITNAPFAGFIGNILVFSRDASVRFTQIAFRQNGAGPQDSRGFYLRTNYSSGWTAWAFLPYQRIDNPGGQPGVGVYTWDDQNNRDQQLMAVGTALGNADLNAVTLTGVYTQNNSANATTANNYPAALNGVLEVRAISGNAVLQRYTPHNGNATGAARVIYERSLTSGTWSSWRALATQRTNAPTGQPGTEVFTWNDSLGAELQLLPAGIDLGSVNLDLIVLAGEYRQTSTVAATLANNYPVAGVAGVLEVIPASGGGNVLQRFTVIGGGSDAAGVYQRRRAGGTFSAWTFMPSVFWEADGTRGRTAKTWDPVNSRYSLTYGDTGWRDISAQLLTGWTGTLRIRRIGYHVSIRGFITRAADGASDHFWALVAGFRATNSEDYGTAIASPISNTTASARDIASNNVNIFLRGAPQGSAWRVFCDYDITEAWPTSLPGSVIGTVPYL